MKFTFPQMFGAALVITLWLIWVGNIIGNALVHVDEVEVAAVTAEPNEASKAPAKAAPAGIAALLASASAEAGGKQFKKCKACHTTNQGGKNRVGPNLWDVVGQAKAARPGFRFSDALKGKGGAWTYDDLDLYLTKPKDFAPGTKMSFAGLKKAADRANVILYLRSLSESPKPLP
ncbi:MAG: cytochrome c family protein [Rhodospirillales bacterium]|jgi:cytochrome c|nr:cytochrome c family protein [Rhodospirillales bacterium]HJO97806.1 cytochrome c family protein [Rhodospirillales bacterium]